MTYRRLEDTDTAVTNLEEILIIMLLMTTNSYFNNKTKSHILKS